MYCVKPLPAILKHTICFFTCRLTFVPDVIPQVPCAPQMMACTDPHNPSYIPLVQSFNYQQVGGNIDFTPEEMPLQKDAWGKLDTINGCK